MSNENIQYPEDDPNFQNLEEFQEDKEEEEEEEYVSNESFDSSTSTSVISWITWYCSLPGHEFFIEVPEEFIEDEFNLYGLRAIVPMYEEALDMILDLDDENPPPSSELPKIERAAELLYGLIHQRFILTKLGLSLMKLKLKEARFGVCPRVYCYYSPVLPCGMTDIPGKVNVKLYCPRCGDLYTPKLKKYKNIDGAYFGTTFPHLFFLTFPELLPKNSLAHPINYEEEEEKEKEEKEKEEKNELQENQEKNEIQENENEAENPNNDGRTYDIYTPKIFGFKIHETSQSGQRMKWLRWREGYKCKIEEIKALPDVYTDD
jgi:casein kinase II subunit beta